MNNMLQNYLKNKVIFWFTFCLFALIVFLEIINHRFEMNDFKVYYLAAKAFFNNESIYGIQFGLTSGYYKYSPVFIIFFSPYLIFSYKTACIIHALILAVSTVMTLISARNILLKHVVQSEIQNKYLLIFAIFITVNHLFREIHLGNLNMIIVMLLCLGFQKILEGGFLLPGFLIALAIFIKPYLIILIIPLFFHKKIKFIWSLSLWIGFLFFLPITFLGSNKFIQLNQKWIHEIFQHGAYLYSNHTFTSLIRNYITLQLNEHSHVSFLLGLIFIYTLVYFTTLKKYSAISEKNNNKALIFSYFILLAIIPNILITDTEHFLYSTPLILFSIYYLQNQPNSKYLILFVVFSVLYGINSTDILGRELSGKFEFWGILGIANLGLIATFLFIQQNVKSKK